MQFAEQHDNENAKGSFIRGLESSVSAEVWLNISRHGHYNRLHTHEGATWSGVLYLSDGKDGKSLPYSGDFIIKPTPHKKEDTYTLKAVELARLSISDDICDRFSCNRCEYFQYSVREGEMLVFPSYLHHAVLPLSIEKAKRASTTRISIDFNFSEEKVI